MSTLFRGGPANDVSLSLERAPRFLRVTRDPRRAVPGLWDALDQLDDVPHEWETLFAYEIEGKPFRAFFRPGGLKTIAYYRFIPDQPSDAEMRDAEAWKRWVMARVEKETA